MVFFMSFKDLFYTIFKSLNPEAYTDLLERKLTNVFKYFLFLLFISFFLFFLILIPVFYSIPSYFDSKLSKFEELNVNFSFKIKEPFYLSESPAIRVEQSGSNLTNTNILITEDGIFYKSFFYFGEKKVIPLREHYDLTQEKSKFLKVLLFIIPSIFFWGMLFFIFYFLLIILFTILISFVILMIINYNIGFVKLLKLCLYSSTILVFSQLLILPFIKSIIMPLVAYWLLILLILFLYKDEKKIHGVTITNYYDKNKDKNIFLKKRNSNINRDVKEKSLKEEDEEYIEWK